MTGPLTQVGGAVCGCAMGPGHHEGGGDAAQDLRTEQSIRQLCSSKMEADRGHGGGD